MSFYRSFLVAMALVIGLGAADGRAAQNPSLDRTLIVGTKEAPPFAMKDSTGSWTGISIQLWRQLAAELNLDFEFRELDLKGLLDGVKGGSLDAAVAALTITPEREKLLEKEVMDSEEVKKIVFPTSENSPKSV